MKRIHAKLDLIYTNIDHWWLHLPLRKQKVYTIYFFSIYFILSSAVIISVWLDSRSKAINIEHIDTRVSNPEFKTLDSTKSVDHERTRK